MTEHDDLDQCHCKDHEYDDSKEYTYAIHDEDDGEFRRVLGRFGTSYCSNLIVILSFVVEHFGVSP